MESEENMPAHAGIGTGLLAFNAFLVLGVVGMAFLIYGVLHEPKRNEVAQTRETVSHVFDDVNVIAKAAYVFDLSTNEVLYKKNEQAQLPLASITKLMMALTAMDLAKKDSRITIKKEFMQEDGDNGLLVDESWKLKDLLDFSLVVSSNDGARSVASVIGALDLKSNDYNLGRKEFVTRMNILAKKIGLKQTYFVNEDGLDEGSVSGGYGSAQDVAKLLGYILKNNPDLVEATKYPTLTINSGNKSHTVKNTNSDVVEIPGLLASKTGYTSMAGGNLAVAFDSSIGRPIVVVVLGSTQEGRFSDVSALVNASLNYIRE